MDRFCQDTKKPAARVTRQRVFQQSGKDHQPAPYRGGVSIVHANRFFGLAAPPLATFEQSTGVMPSSCRKRRNSG